MSGGSDTMKGFAAFAYDDDKGVLLNTYARKFSAKANLDFQVVKWLKVSERVSYEYKNGQGDVGTGHEGVLNQIRQSSSPARQVYMTTTKREN